LIEVDHEARQLLVGAALMLVTAVIQTFGVVLLEESVGRIRDPDPQHMTRRRMLGVLCGVIVYLFALHLLEMLLWAGFYSFVAGYRSFSVALYESALAFTSMDIAKLPPSWKFLSAAEGVTGLLMFAWSTGILFNHTSRVTEARLKYLSRHHMFGVKERAAPPVH
jgi:voltage-gated potassium channel